MNKLKLEGENVKTIDNAVKNSVRTIKNGGSRGGGTFYDGFISKDTEDAEEITAEQEDFIDDLFSVILVECPAWKSQFTTSKELSDIKRSYIRALIRHKEKFGFNPNIKFGRIAIADRESSFVPSASEFIAMCEDSAGEKTAIEKALARLNSGGNKPTVDPVAIAIFGDGTNKFNLQRMNEEKQRKSFTRLYQQKKIDLGMGQAFATQVAIENKKLLAIERQGAERGNPGKSQIGNRYGTKKGGEEVRADEQGFAPKGSTGKPINYGGVHRNKPINHFVSATGRRIINKAKGIGESLHDYNDRRRAEDADWYQNQKPTVKK